jgi:hypothetical protein
VAIYTFEARGIPRSRVAGIFSAGAFAQIGDAVISTLAVDVIDLFPRVLAGDMKPGEPMRTIAGFIDFDNAISASVPGARFAAYTGAAASDPPIKKPRFRGVIEQFPQPLGGQPAFQFAEHEGSLPKEERPAADQGSGRYSPFPVFLGYNGAIFAPVFADGANRWCNFARAAPKKRAHKRTRLVVFRAKTKSARRPLTAPGAISLLHFRDYPIAPNGSRKKFVLAPIFADGAKSGADTVTVLKAWKGRARD